ncbi:MAG: hypothetical protein R2716_07795 [Microthrixaceae bacterium]
MRRSASRRHWNEDDGRTHTLRTKEEADDYRYFPEPDLVDLDPDHEWIERVREALPLLPAQRRHRLAEAAGCDLERTALVVERGLDELSIAAIGSGADPDRVLTHAEHNLSDERAVQLDPAAFAELVAMETGGELTATQAKTVLAEMVELGEAPRTVAARHGFEAMDTSELEAILDGLVADHPEEWQRFCDGDSKVAGFFVGQVMKATRGQADGKVVTSLMNARKG